MPVPYKATSLPTPPISPAGEIFVEKYDLLLHWALRLAQGNREQAEDLLHEAFVQFSLRQPDLSGIENIDGYLYSVLKHLHLALLRRAKRDPLNQISPVEFDSVDLALRSSYEADQVDVQNDLRRICSFLCWRKTSAKSASYLILRFFLGYYPEEIVRIALASRNVVDHGIRIASSEARVYLTDPKRLRFMPGRGKQEKQARQDAQDSVSKFAPVLFPVPASEFLHSLNQMILASRLEECPPREELLKLYERIPAVANEGSSSSLDRTLLAHLVSCPPCLDAVNQHLRMPPLSDRFPGERLGRFRPDLGEGRSVVRRAPEGRGSQMHEEQAFQEMRTAVDGILKVAQTRLRECFEHQPKKLIVAVNGEIVAAQEITSEHNKQSIRLNKKEPIDFIEVFSEQRIRLAFISMAGRSLERSQVLSQHVPLSSGRSLEASLGFTSSSLSLEVTYNDPLLAHTVDPLADEFEQEPQWILDPETSVRSRSISWGKWIKELLISVPERWAGSLESFRVPIFGTALLLLFAAVGGLYFAHTRRQSLEAEAVLDAALQQESRPIAAGHLVHRVFDYEVTSPDGLQTIQRGTVDVWKGAEKTQFAMRLSSQDGALQAGIWKSAEGSYSSYKNHKLIDHAATPDGLRDAVTADSESRWMSEPSAGAFKALTSSQGSMAIRHLHDDSVIEYRPVTNAVAGNRPHLVNAVLTLHSNRRAINEVLWIEQDGQVRRYSYREVRYEEREATSSDTNIFSPDESLVRKHAFVKRSSILSASKAVFLAHLNLKAFVLLNTVNADSGEQIAVTRTPSQRLSIRGVLPSEGRLAEVKRALAPLDENPFVDISLTTADQLSAASSDSHSILKPSSITVESYEIDAQTIPAEGRLKAYFSRRGYSGKDLDKQIEGFCQEALSHSSKALQQAWTLHILASSFSMDDWRHMSPNDRKQWIALYLRHSTDLQAEAQAIHQSLAVLLLNASSDTAESKQGRASTEPSLSSSQASLNALSDQLLEQSSVADRVLRSALTASGGPVPDLDNLFRQLQLSLASTDRAIQEIEYRAQSLEVSKVVR